MNWTWIGGGVHAGIGATLLFLCLHPLRDALEPAAFELVKTASTWQALVGAALLATAGKAGRVAPALLFGGAAVTCLMVWIIVFTGTHPFDAAVPAGGMVTILGWILLVVSGRRASGGRS